MDRKPMPQVDNDVKRQTPHGDKCRVVKIFLTLFLISAAFSACITVLGMYYGDDDHYSVAIDSASVLDLKTGLSFNLTIGVASLSHGVKTCIDPGMFVEVLYRDVQVAATDPAETRRTCARPRNVAELPVVAKATMLPVGHMQDSLAAELEQGAAMFDLRLNIPSYGKTGMSLWLLYCKGGRVGEAAVPCNIYKTI